MREVEATGKNIEQAIQNALLELKASREDVDIKILSEGGFLKKAKVLVSISEDALEKYERKEELKSLNVVSEDENAIWLIDYWCNKDIRGLIQMPFSRHWIMHVEACLRIKNKIQC